MPDTVSDPHWSPDGKQILFSGFDSSHLYVISRDGGAQRMLPTGDYSSSASWLPGGNSVLYQDYHNPDAHVLKLLDLKSLQLTTIADSQGLRHLVISPDGRYLAAAALDSQKLMLFDFHSQKWTELFKMDVGTPSWSRDSKYIYFNTGLSEKPAFCRLRVSDRKLEQVVDLKEFRNVVFDFLPWSGITPEGEPLLLRDVSSQEVYALDFESP